jgi:hypothetical protein
MIEEEYREGMHVPSFPGSIYAALKNVQSDRRVSNRQEILRRRKGERERGKFIRNE